MQRKLFIATLTIGFFLAVGCEKEDERIDNFFVDFATVVNLDRRISFQLNNRRMLIPKEPINYSGKTGQRVILNYTPLRGDTVKVNHVSDIFTGDIQMPGFFQQPSKDPIKIQSVWVDGDYLNMIFEAEYHSVQHLIGLFIMDPSSTPRELYFSHSRNNDPPGYPQTFYASFLIKGLRYPESSDSVPFRLFVNTYEGLREFDLTLE
ncbi:MAG: NigD-like C-terminal domain-containing protein [Dysgonamonadaceae bacterium]|jgi:hypothetical protein|nr:NigD-like C-terminal domain-containing protein [Dysgonamonadaceae bacterium]MDD3495118.1 NigD-like C-terminal domain-containing protein [Dysgonamonadaceae bacterium]